MKGEKNGILLKVLSNILCSIIVTYLLYMRMRNRARERNCLWTRARKQKLAKSFHVNKSDVNDHHFATVGSMTPGGFRSLHHHMVV